MPLPGLLTNGRVHAEFTVANSYVFSDLVDCGMEHRVRFPSGQFDRLVQGRTAAR